MAQPTPYTRQYNFTDYQTTSPNDPLPASQLDAELNAVKTTSDETRVNLGMIQRDDGKLKNQAVHKDSFDRDALALIGVDGFNPLGAWAAATAYAPNDLVDYNDATYVCLVAHTSSAAFATDLGAGNWLLIANSAIGNVSSSVDYFEGDGSTTAFTLTYNYPSSTGVQVYVNGVLQLPTDGAVTGDYDISGTTLTFVTAPAAPSVAGRKNVVVWGANVTVQANVQAAQTYAANSLGYSNASAASATASAASAAAAATSETNAAASETAAAASEAAAATSETNAAASESAAATSETNAAASEAAAATSETNAAASETAAAASETAALASQTAAASSATAAATSANTATTQATAASGSATNAAASAATATTQATNASNSATAAAGSATSASTSATTATNQASTATTQATNAAASATAAATSETNAAASETAAAASESAAATSETNAATSETNAAASATAAAASASAAAISETNAAASAASAAATLDNFDDRYLGAKAADPALDNDGNALITGALYFNTTDGVMKIYTASGWIAASSASVATMNKFKFTATASQTSFTGADDDGNTLSITVGAEIVTLNGIVLEAGTDYTPASGSITLATGAAASDELNVYAFGNFQVADTVSKSLGGTFSGAVDFTGGLTVNSASVATTGKAIAMAIVFGG